MATARVKSAKSVMQYQAMDRAYCLARAIDDQLDSHPAIEGDEVATDLIETVQAAMWSLYKRLGGEELC